MRKYFEGIRIYVLNFGKLKKNVVMIIHGIGIFIGKKGVYDKDLLRYEFEHILQYRKWGALIFWFKIAPASLKSANKIRGNKELNHMNIWTEWYANYLSYNYFNKPSDWNFKIILFIHLTKINITKNNYNLSLSTTSSRKCPILSRFVSR